MQTKFMETTNTDAGGMNWGKFMVARFTESEWERRSKVGGQIMLAERGWSKDNLLVLDLQTGEGAVFKPKGYAKGDLDKHALWVCPLFEPFLGWLYEQDLTDIEKLPALVKIKNPASALYGYRRPGPGATQRKPAEQMPAKRAGKKSAKSH
jgi:hypothetical protein